MRLFQVETELWVDLDKISALGANVNQHAAARHAYFLTVESFKHLIDKEAYEKVLAAMKKRVVWTYEGI